ncbi:hypothetical protein AXY1_66 [Achromobacter phage AXY1]|nr:hypothetical protein AXY1_66 [Achromobacter phage AXY1]
MDYPVLASSETLDIDAPVDLWAGSMPIVTNRGVVAALTGARLAQYGIVLRLEDDTITDYRLPIPDGAHVAGIAAVSGVNGDGVPYYTGGYFNWEVISNANSGTTMAELRALFAALPTIQFGTILK